MVTQIPWMPENRCAVSGGLPPGILGKPIHRGGGGAAKCLSTGRLQMHMAWQPSLPLKRKELAVFWDSPLSLGKRKTKQNPKPSSSLCCLRPCNTGRLPALNFIYHLRPYVEILITDIFIFISQTEKACLSSKPLLLKRLELTPSAAGRMVTSERRRESLVLLEGQSWCRSQLVSGYLGGHLHHSQRLHYFSPPKTSKSLWLT